MKKITLLSTALMLFGFLQAQQTISFEAAEGYTLGDINTQNGWVVTGDGVGGFISNQVVSDEMATDGTYSFKIDEDTAFSGQSSAIMGGFYDYSVPIPYADAVISADVYMSELDGANFRLGTVNLGLGQFTIILEFDWLGNIWVVENDVFVDTGVSWSALTWYNVRLETTGSTVKYFIDDVEIYETALIVDGDIDQVRFVHDNYGGYAYIDNLRTNDEPLSISNQDISKVSVSPNPVKNILKINSINTVDRLQIINQLGQEVMTLNRSQLTNKQVDLSDLANGIYIVKLNAEGKSKTLKVVKQ